MNTRSSFRNQIDEHEFHYIRNKNIQIGLKELTFENRYNTFETRYGSPHMIIVQNIHGKKLNPKYGKILQGPDLPDIDIESGFDYYFLSDQKPSYRIGHIDAQRSFTDVKISVSIPALHRDHELITRFAVHNIYFKESNLESDEELISYLNYVYHNIEFDIPSVPEARLELFRLDKEKKTLFEIDKDGFTVFSDKRYMELDIFLSRGLCEILGFNELTLEAVQGKSLRGILESNFRSKKYENIKNDPNWVFRPLYRPEDLETFTNDSNIKKLLDFQWGEECDYLRISQNGNIVDTFHNKVTSNKKINFERGKPNILGLRTSLTKADIFKNCVYDTQIEFVNVKDRAEGVQTFNVKNPSLYETSIENISNAKFELIDIDTGKKPNFTVGTPTYMHFHVSNNSRMSKRFNIFFDSSDTLSKIYFPTNKSADFCIKLPERLVFDKQWEIALKNIFIGNDLYNVYSDSCWLSVTIYKSPTEAKKDDQFYTKLFLQDGLYKTTKELCKHIQSLFDREKLNLKISVKRHSTRVKLTCEEKRESGRYLRYTVILSPHLANILGYDLTNNQEFSLPFIPKKTFIATFTPKIELLIPRNFMVLCDVVSESVFGSKTVKILKLLSSNFVRTREIMTFSFDQDEFVELAIKEFSSIRIQVLDTTGNLIKSLNTHPTRCQIQFKLK